MCLGWTLSLSLHLSSPAQPRARLSLPLLLKSLALDSPYFGGTLALGFALLASTLTPPTLSSRRGPNAGTREHDITALTPNTTPASVMAVFSGIITISGDGSRYAVSAARTKRLTPRLLGRIATDWVLELLPAARSGHLADELLRGRGRCKSTSVVLRSKLYTSSGT